MIAVLVKRLTGLPVVTTVHSDYRLDYLQNIFKMFSFGLINMVSLRFIDFHIAVSKTSRQCLLKESSVLKTYLPFTMALISTRKLILCQKRSF